MTTRTRESTPLSFAARGVREVGKIVRKHDREASRELVEDLKRSLSDPRAVCGALGLGVHLRDRQFQAAGIIVRCPLHHGVSLSVTRGRNGTIRVKCFGCGDLHGDVFDLIAAVENLSVRDDFPAVICAASRLANRSPPTRLVSAAEAHRERADAMTRSFPPAEEVNRVWGAAGSCAADGEVTALLAARGLSASAIDKANLARVIAEGAILPKWARFRGQRERSASWLETGHRLILPGHDEAGEIRSLRAWCVRETDDPKRVPPAGHRAAGLVLACRRAVAMLQGTVVIQKPRSIRILIVEGEPDFLTWATRAAATDVDVPLVIGVSSGSWSERFAARFPVGARVIIRTHHDAAGDRYAETIRETLSHRCAVLRPEAGNA